jgi:V/A-type H+-transporting ATPase subunit C
MTGYTATTSKKARPPKDTDYLFLSAYVRAKETKLIGRSALERMLDARGSDGAARIIEEVWGVKIGSDTLNANELETLLSDHRRVILADMLKLSPNKKIVEFFCLKYDYHNAKTLVKARAIDVKGEHLLQDCGRVNLAKLKTAFLLGDFRSLPLTLANAVAEASEVLAQSGEPGLADFILDKAYFAELAEYAAATRSEFLVSYTRLVIDTANLRAVVRAIRGGSDYTPALADGGSVEVNRILAAKSGDIGGIMALYKNTELQLVLETAVTAAAEGSLTEFERLCDNVLVRYLSQAKRTGFSEKPLIAYLGAVESEISAVRTVMTGQLAGISADTIRTRIREAYSE